MADLKPFSSLGSSFLEISFCSLEIKMLVLQFLDSLAHCKNNIEYTPFSICQISGASFVIYPTYLHEIILLLALAHMQVTAEGNVSVTRLRYYSFSFLAWRSMVNTTILYFAKRTFSDILEGVASSPQFFWGQAPRPPFFNRVPIKHDYFGAYFFTF